MTEKNCQVKRIASAVLLFFVISLAVPVFGSSDPSGISTYSTGAAKKAPKVHKAVSLDGCILISWNAVNNVSGYKIYRRKDGQKKYRLLKKIKDENQTCFRDKKAVPGVSYDYAVCTYKKSGSRTILSPKASAGTNIVCQPDTPVIKKLRETDGRITISWTAVKKASGYRIEKKTSGSSKWVKVANVSAKKKKLTIEKGKKTAKYAVRAIVKKKGETLISDRSPSVSDAVKKYTGEKILFIGDSITYGYGTKTTRVAVPYPERVKQLTGISYKNAGITGCNFARKKMSDSKSIAARTQMGGVSYSGYTTIVLACGTNDYANNVKLGSASDTTAFTFCGAVNETIAEIRSQNPDAEIVLITPIYRLKMKKIWGKKGGYKDKNKVGCTLLDYCRAVKKLAKKNKVRCYDSQNAKIFTASNAKRLLSDGLHPTQAGYIALGDSIAAYLQKVMKKD